MHTHGTYPSNQIAEKFPDKATKLVMGCQMGSRSAQVGHDRVCVGDSIRRAPFRPAFHFHGGFREKVIPLHTVRACFGTYSSIMVWDRGPGVMRVVVMIDRGVRVTKLCSAYSKCVQPQGLLLVTGS